MKKSLGWLVKLEEHRFLCRLTSQKVPPDLLQKNERDFMR